MSPAVRRARALGVGLLIAAAMLHACAEPACDDSLRVDGLVGGGAGCEEYPASPMVGIYGVVHVAFAGGRLHLHNDWLLRDQADTPADAYNLFELLDINGDARVEVRVFRDDRIETRIDGELVGQGDEGAAAFAASARKAAPHMQYEFAVRLPEPKPGTPIGWLLAEKDPGPGPITNPDDALVAEPTAMFLDPVNGSVEAKEGPVLIRPRREGAVVTIEGRALGSGGKVLRSTNKPVTVQSWSDVAVAFTGPGLAAGERIRVRRDDGLESNGVRLHADEVPPFDGKDCTAVAAGAACDDGKACTAAEVCDGKGACVGKPSCPGVGPCTEAGCAADGSCLLTPRPAQTSCGAASGCTEPRCDGQGNCATAASADGAPCDDGRACTTAETCKGGVCSGVPACPSGTPCRVGACDPGGGCVYADAPDGQGCEDGNQCTGNDTCKAGICVGGAAASCTDGGPCLLATCKPAVGCSQAPRPAGTTCDDGKECTVADACDGAGSCKGSPVAGCGG